MTTLNTNLKNPYKATTQFQHYEFDSMCNFNGKQYVCGRELGLCRLGGNHDSQDNINAWFVTMENDFNIPNQKHIRYVYIGYESDGQIKFEIPESNYSVITNNTSKDTYKRSRLSISRNVQHRYWVFKVSNVDGSDFSINSIDCIFIFRNNGIS